MRAAGTGGGGGGAAHNVHFILLYSIEPYPGHAINHVNTIVLLTTCFSLHIEHFDTFTTVLIESRIV